MKFKITHTLDKASSKGIVYVIEVTLEERKLVKIGMTTRSRVEERITEILTEVWKRYRYFPHTYVARYKKMEDPLGKEALLHGYFQSYVYHTEHVFGGSTEFFEVDVQLVKDAYDRLYATGTPNENTDTQHTDLRG